MPLEPQGNTIFCDDIRLEIGGKLSLMGIYGQDMVLHGATYPAIVPKIVAFISYVESAELERRPLEVRIYLPGDSNDAPSVRAAIAESPPSEQSMDPEVGPRVRSVKFHVILGPLAIEQPGRIKVRMLRNGDEIPLGTLDLRIARESEQFALS
jgi:hypothetical protein